MRTQRRTHAVETWRCLSVIACLWCASLVGAAEPETAPIGEGPGNALRQKLVSIVIPAVDFHGVSLEHAVAWISQRSKELDPGHEGVNILLKSSTAAVAPQPPPAVLSLSLTDVPLGRLLEQLASDAGLVYRVDPHAVLLLAKRELQPDWRTVYVKLHAGVFETPATAVKLRRSSRPLDADNQDAALDSASRSVQAFLEELGVSFPPGATIGFPGNMGTLVVRNTQENVALIDAITQPLDRPRALNLVEIHVSLMNGDKELMAMGASGVPCCTFTCRRDCGPVSNAATALMAPKAVPRADGAAPAQAGSHTEPIAEHVMNATPTLNDDNSILVKLSWEALITPPGATVPRQLSVDTTLHFWSGESVRIPVAAAGEIPGYGELVLQVRATLIRPDGQPWQPQP